MTPLASVAVGAVAALATGEQAVAQSLIERRGAAVQAAPAAVTSHAKRDDDRLVAIAAPVAEPPDLALLAATRAYRDARRYDDAERLAREGWKRFPEQPVWPLLLALILVDSGRAEDALAILRQPAAQRAPPVERFLAEGYAWRRAGEPMKALSAYADALKLAPSNGEARSATAELLQAQGGAFGAAAIAGTDGPYAADEAAALVRWGSDLRPADPALRFEGTDKAIARLEQLLRASPQPSDGARRRLRLDRMVALRDRVRMQEVVEEGGALEAAAALPPYAEEAYADALLYLRRPKAARDSYRRVLAAKALAPEARLRARYGVFYASVEVEDFKTAYATIDALLNEQPIWLTYRDGPAHYNNPDRAFAEITAANARFYGNQLAQAWARITRITEAAPANPGARMALYGIARARGWPRLAKAEGQIAASLDPASLDAATMRVEMAIADYRFAEARRLVAALLAQYPESVRVRQLARDLKAILGWVVELDAGFSNSQGGGANASNQALTLSARLTSPPIADHWRLVVFSDYANAHPPEGYVERTRLSAGAEWRASYVTAMLYANGSTGTLGKGGAGASLGWVASDRIRIGVAGELYTWDTPLRALLHGITADQVSGRITYQWNESRSLSAGAAYLPFSDGNHRYSASLTFNQALISEPHFRLAGNAEAYVSKNDRAQAPYYNPEHDRTLAAGLLAEHILWRRYQSSLVQALSVNAGVYSEARYPADWIATVSYEQRWRFDPWTGFAYGVSLRRRVYDGAAETALAFTFRLSRRF